VEGVPSRVVWTPSYSFLSVQDHRKEEREREGGRERERERERERGREGRREGGRERERENTQCERGGEIDFQFARS